MKPIFSFPINWEGWSPACCCSEKSHEIYLGFIDYPRVLYGKKRKRKEKVEFAELHNQALNWELVFVNVHSFERPTQQSRKTLSKKKSFQCKYSFMPLALNISQDVDPPRLMRKLNTYLRNKYWSTSNTCYTQKSKATFFSPSLVQVKLNGKEFLERHHVDLSTV